MKPRFVVLQSYVACIMQVVGRRSIVRLLRSPASLQIDWGDGLVLLGQGALVVLLNMQLADIRTIWVCVVVCAMPVGLSLPMVLVARGLVLVVLMVAHVV